MQSRDIDHLDPDCLSPIITDNVKETNEVPDQDNAYRVGEPVPSWQEGHLDLHHINTGAGDAGFFILPDGTTLLYDAGELDPTTERYRSPRQTPPKPDGSQRPFEWIAAYIRRMHPTPQHPVLDYAVLTHFHDDHVGDAHARSPTHYEGGFLKTGFAGVCSEFPVRRIIDRGYPDYAYPIRSDSELLKRHFGAEDGPQVFSNYVRFLNWAKTRGTRVESFRAGARDQITMQHNRSRFPSFECRILYANGELWTGQGDGRRPIFPDIAALDIDELPTENACSAAALFRYGEFTYFNGSDIPGIPNLGEPDWIDVESPMAEVVGPVDVQVLNHHGYRNTQNLNFTRILSPRVYVQQNWSADQPGHDVFLRMISEKVYPGPRDLFATSMADAVRQVIGPRIDSAYGSTSGHILLRVEPSTEQYRVIILDDSDVECRIKDTFGPYKTR